MLDSDSEYKTGHNVISVNLCKENTLYIVCAQRTYGSLSNLFFKKAIPNPNKLNRNSRENWKLPCR